MSYEKIVGRLAVLADIERNVDFLVTPAERDDLIETVYSEADELMSSLLAYRVELLAEDVRSEDTALVARRHRAKTIGAVLPAGG